MDHQRIQDLLTKTKEGHGKDTVDKDDNVIPLIESVFQKLQDGKISYDQYTRYEMTDLGFDPNKESDVKKYIEFMENLTYLESSNILSDNDNEE